MISSETISVAVQAVINLEKSRSGSALLEKLAGLSERDVEELDRLLGEWSVRDALSVLDEIDRRVTVLEAIRKLSSDPKVDELHTLHPLVTQARWLFGPEFDSPEFSSNSSLKNAVETVFKKSVDPDAFLNAKRRPDLLVLRDATLCAVATERYDEDRGLVGFKNVLLTELKRGGAKLGRKDVHQATDYVEDLLRCGHLDGSPFIRAFVVGHEIGPKIERERKIGDQPESARITATTYGQLERTGAKRLFSLRKRLQSRYSEITGVDLAKRLGVKPQLPLFTS